MAKEILRNVILLVILMAVAWFAVNPVKSILIDFNIQLDQRQSFLLFMGIFIALSIGTLFILWPRRKETLHGSACWAEYDDIAEFVQKSPEKGLALGRFGNGFLRVKTHVTTCAPTRSGKGIGGIIPAVLEHPGSLILFDPKGEGYAVAARRRKELKSVVCLIDPFGISGDESSKYNWLDFIDTKNPDAISRVAVLTDMIATDADSNYFDDSAKSLLQCLILYVCSVGTETTRHMGQVRELLMLPLSGFTSLLKDMAQSQDAFGVIAKLANQFLSTQEQGAGKELSGVINSAKRFTAFLDDPRIVECLRASDFDLSKIKEENLSIFIVMPADKIEPYKAFIRVFFSQALSSVMATQQKPKYGDVLFLYDEFAQLGYMEQVENAVSLVRGFGGQFWIFVQDLSQLKGIYKKWQTFLANSTRLFYGCADIDTAKYISETLGKQTLESYSENLQTEGRTKTLVGRELLTPDEVLKLPPSEPIALLQGLPPVKLRRLCYYQDKEYKGQFDPNPFYS